MSPREFEALPLPGQPTDLPRRVMETLQQGYPEAFSADEIAAALLGRKPGWSSAFDPKVANLVPAVRDVLAQLLLRGLIEVRSKNGLAGPEHYVRAKQTTAPPDGLTA